MIKLMIKVCVFIYFVGVGLHLTMQYAKADEYTTATTAHIITQTVTKGDIDHKKVLTAELERLIHRMAIDMTFVMQKHLPNILEGIAAEIREDADRIYKESQTNQGGFMENFIYSVADTLQLMYSIAPKEIWIIVFASIFLYLHLEYKDWKNNRNK